jgi:hypothetical protein
MPPRSQPTPHSFGRTGCATSTAGATGPDGGLDRAWAVVERMTAINSQDERTLSSRGLVRVAPGEYHGGLADLRCATRSILTTPLPSSCWPLPRRPWARPGRRKRTPSSRCGLARGTAGSEAPISRWRWHTLRCGTMPKLCAGANLQSRFRVMHRRAVPYRGNLVCCCESLSFSGLASVIAGSDATRNGPGVAVWVGCNSFL